MKYGQRAFIGKVSMDRNSPDYYIESTETGCYEAELFARRVLLRTVVGAAYVQSVDTKLVIINDNEDEPKFIPLLKNSGSSSSSSSSSSSGNSSSGVNKSNIILNGIGGGFDDNTTTAQDDVTIIKKILATIQQTIPLVSNLTSLLNQPFTPIIMPCVTPRFAPSCTNTMMQFLGQLSMKYGLPVQSHLSESIKEVKWVAKLYPDCDNYTSVYKKYGLLHENVYMAHCIYCNKVERKLLATCKTGIVM